MTSPRATSHKDEYTARCVQARKQMNAHIIAACAANDELASEIEHKMSVGDREYAYDPMFALFDIMVVAGQSRNVITACRRILIELGFYRVMTEEEISNTWTSSKQPVWDFELGGMPYTTDKINYPPFSDDCAIDQREDAS